MKFLRQIHPTILLLGFVSLLNDLAGELIMAVLPTFLINLPGSGGWVVGLIGGLEDGVRSVLSLIFGGWADRHGRKKPFIILGYFIPSVSRILLPFSTHWTMVLGFRVIDRVGKGIRTAPRDALMADVVAEGARGINFGFHRAMDTAGALAGSVLAFVFYWWLGLELKWVILIGGLVSMTSLIPLLFVQETNSKPNHRTLLGGLSELPRIFYWNLGAMALFALGNFSYMLFLLKVNSAFTDQRAVGIPILMYIIYNLVYTAFATPAGILSDRIGRRSVLLIGYGLFTLACAGFAYATQVWAFVPLFMVYGLAYAFIESNQKAFVADVSPVEQRATAMGVFQLTVGLASLVGSAFAGWLWGTQESSHALTFYYGSVMALVGVIALLALARLKRS